MVDERLVEWNVKRVEITANEEGSRAIDTFRKLHRMGEVFDESANKIWH